MCIRDRLKLQHLVQFHVNEVLNAGVLQKYGTVAIANLGGHSEEEYVERCV